MNELFSFPFPLRIDTEWAHEKLNYFGKIQPTIHEGKPHTNFGSWYGYTWLKVRMRYAMEKALLVLCNEEKVWIAKSRIRKVRFKGGWFWVCVRK